MPVLTFGALKASDVPDIAGVCATSDQFRNYTNKATRMLMTRGNFWGTVERLKICTYNACVVAPDFVGTILAANTPCSPTTHVNDWYDFMPLSVGDFCGGSFSFSGGHCGGDLKLRDFGVSPVYQQIRCGQEVYIRVFPSTHEDVGKKTTIFGVDSNGQEILTQRADLTWQPGVELTLALPYVSTSFQCREITRIHKEVTEGPVRYYQFDSVNNVLIDLLILKPYETDPMYRQFRIGHQCHNGRCNTGNCNGLRSIDMIVKLQFMPVKFDEDLVLISNQDALRDMIMSIRYADAGDKQQSAAYELSAIHELNLEVDDKIPKETTPVDINPFGSGLPVRHWVGRVY